MADKGKVIVGLSGGVDSAVTAYLLKQEGYEVIGVTLQVYDSENQEGEQAIQTMLTDAEKVARLLDITHVTAKVQQEFSCHVADRFIRDYLNGRTPNPCVQCNRDVKWKTLLAKAEEYGAALVATGHYASVVRLPNGRYTVHMADKREKDQTYVLYRLSQEQLAKTRMPLAGYSKEQVRKIAAAIGMEVAKKADSQEICFIPDNDYAGYLQRHAGQMMPPEGNFVDASGKILGRHKGIQHYTVGQRKGLGIALGAPAFVLAIRPDANEVVLGTNEETMASELYANEIYCMGVEDCKEPLRAIARIRYSHRGAACEVRKAGEDRIHVVFDEPQRAITPGQSVVIYDGEGNILLGGCIL